MLALALSVSLTAPTPPAAAVAFAPDGKLVAVGHAGRVVGFTVTPVARAFEVSAPGRVTAVAFAPAGGLLAVAAGEPGRSGVVHLFAVAAGKATQAAVLPGHKDSVYALAFSPDGKTLATAGYDRVIRLWDAAARPTGDAKPTPARELTDHSDAVYALAFHPTGELLASASADRTVKVWDAATGTRLYTLGDATDWLYAVAWTPDGSRVAAGGVDKSVRQWAADKTAGKLAKSAYAHAAPVVRVAFDPTGRVLFTAGEDRVVKRWDATTLTETAVFAPQPDAILDLAVSPDGTRLAVARFDGSAVLLDATTGKVAATLLPEPPVPPVADGVSPVAVVRGRTTTVTLTGKHLHHSTGVTADRPGVTAKLTAAAATSATVELTVPAAVPAGAVRLTLTGDAGKSAPQTVAIDRHPAVAEAGATDSARTGMAVTLPTTVAGVIDRAGDADFFRFDGKGGQQLGVQVVAAEIGSKLEPVLTVTDANGVILVERTGTTLGVVLPAAGRYSVGVRDREFRGGPTYPYRLQLGNVPVVAGVFPLAGQRDTTANVNVVGVNLGPASSTPVSVTIPADAVVGSKVIVPVHVAGDTPLGKAELTVGEYPAVPAADGTVIPVPGSADGVLASAGESQAVRFTAKKGQRLAVEVLARRAGSPVDPVVEILDAAGTPVPRTVLRAVAKTNLTFRDHDSAKPGLRLEAWNELAADDHIYADGELMRILALPGHPDADCDFYQVGGRRLGFLGTTPGHHAVNTAFYKVEVHPPGRTFPPNGLPTFVLPYRNDDGGPGFDKDSFLLFDPPADGTYQVRVTDAAGAAGPAHAYRLTVRPAKPDYTLSVSPASPLVWKGSGVPVTVTATRLDGFDGPIRIEMAGLPAGLTAPVGVIEGNLVATVIALHAGDTNEVPADVKLRAVGIADIGGERVIREAAFGAVRLADGADLTCTTRQRELVIQPGGRATFTVDVGRRNGFAGRVPVEVKGLPHGVTVQDIGLNNILITERETTRDVVLYAEPWVTPMTHPVCVFARREGKGTEHAAPAVILRVGKESPSGR